MGISSERYSARELIGTGVTGIIGGVCLAVYLFDHWSAIVCWDWNWLVAIGTILLAVVAFWTASLPKKAAERQRAQIMLERFERCSAQLHLIHTELCSVLVTVQLVKQNIQAATKDPRPGRYEDALWPARKIKVPLLKLSLPTLHLMPPTISAALCQGYANVLQLIRAAKEPVSLKENSGSIPYQVEYATLSIEAIQEFFGGLALGYMIDELGVDDSNDIDKAKFGLETVCPVSLKHEFLNWAETT